MCWLPGWTIDYHHMISSTVATGADGRFALELIPDGYLVVARDAQPDVWQSTGAVRDMTTAGGGAIASRNDDASYWIEIADDQTVHGLVFGRVCIGPDGAVQATPATCPPPTFAAVR